MKGCRALTDPEIDAVKAAMAAHRYPARDRALFLVGLKTGFRISELLSLTLADVYQNGKIPPEIYVARRKMKGKGQGRSVPFMNPEARAALELWIAELLAAGHAAPETFVFRSREGGNRALHRASAWEMLKNAFDAAGLNGKLATHTMRKTFAKRMRELLGNDLQALQEAMGHKRITSTMNYIEVDGVKIRTAFEKL